MLIIFLNNVDIQLILEFKVRFWAYCPSFLKPQKLRGKTTNSIIKCLTEAVLGKSKQKLQACEVKVSLSIIFVFLFIETSLIIKKRKKILWITLGRTNCTRYGHWYVTGKYLFEKQNETVIKKEKKNLVKEFFRASFFVGKAVLLKMTVL